MWSNAKSWLKREDGESRQRELAAQRKHIRNAGRVLQLMNSGVLLLDEIDVILHPLRSELNWPLGRKVPLVSDIVVL